MPSHTAYQAIAPSLPSKPGVYHFLNKEGKTLYVGKAKNLKRRVSSYFTKLHNSARMRLLVSRVDEIRYTIVDSEQEALLLENTLIKKKQPRYNIQLKDDKSYPFICIKNERFPRIFLTRKVVQDGSTYLGPYTSVKRVRAILELIKKLYPIRTCKLNLSEKNIKKGKYKICLEYHIGNCLGPCEGLQSEEDYNINIEKIEQILKGKYKPALDAMELEMKQAAADYQFEKAELLKQKMASLKNYKSKTTVVNPSLSDIDVFAITEDEKSAYICHLRVMNGCIVQTKLTSVNKNLNETAVEILSYAIGQKEWQKDGIDKEIIVPFAIELLYDSKVTIPQRGDKKKLLDFARVNALHYKTQRIQQASAKKLSSSTVEVLEQLRSDFRLKELPYRIECFDNSNFQGAEPVASLVVFKNAKPHTSDYRKFNIKTVVGPNDFASMKEVVFRRYKRLKEEQEPFPQLLIVDGGKGQLNAAVEALDELGLRGKLAVAGIAKRLEEIYLPDDPLPLYISKRSSSLKVIQHLRNEAHRFAITFHRSKRLKKTISTELTKIEGIGEKTASQLIRHFKSVKRMKESSPLEIQKVVDKKKAKAIIDYFGL